MLYRKYGFPEESDIVICTITSVQYNSVFANLDEYPGKSGIIHISEISPGRIRNIRDYVKEGKKVICKVLRVNEERGHIDLSLRRVNESQKRNKNDELKKEMMAEKIVEFAAKELKLKFEDLYRKVFESVSKEYDYLYPCFEDHVVGNYDIKRLNLDKKIIAKLDELIKQRIKPPEVFISGSFTLITYAPDGIEVIKKALKPAVRENVTLKYFGAGKYGITFVAEDYKECEEMVEEVTEAVINNMEKLGGEAKFERDE